MEEIAVSQNNQNYSSENGVLFNKNKTSLIDCPSKKTGSYTIPNSVTTIIGHAFDNCSNLTSITIPNSVASICEYAFTVCSSLTSITIPDSVTSIGENAFRLCSSLTSVTIPNSMTNISKGAFESCESLTDVYYGGIKSEWDRISIGLHNAQLTNAFIHCNDISSKQLTNVQDNSGNTLTLLENAVLDIGENLYFRNGYVDASKGYIKTGDRKITGSNIHFTNEGKIRLDDGENAKIVRDNGDGTTDQGFVFGKYNPSGIVKVTLDATGEAGGVDYTGKTVEHEFDFTSSEMYGLINFGFAINNIPKPIKFYVHED
ncbi:MAG: leucine-rich repeat domain-containing protein [Clostridia bacterium]|nr:leucine-rich repeat domain-containing protein [Clostridia bacterium]